MSAWSAPSAKPASRARSFAGASSGRSRRMWSERRLGGRELVELVLGEVADAQLVRRGDPPAHLRQPAGEQLRERGLALAVAAQQRDAVVLIDPKVEAREHRRAAVAHRRALGRDDGGRELLGLGEGEAARGRLLGARDGLHPRQRLQPRLRLARLVGLVAEPVHVGLKVRAPRLLLLGLGLGHGQPLGAGAREDVVGALVEGELAVLQVQDRAHGAVEEPAVVADHEDRVRVAREVALEPERALEVEVVGGLVQQQQVGRGEEHRGQRHAHPPAAGEVGAGARLLLGLEAQAPQDRRRARLGRPGVDVGEPRLDLGDARGVARRLGLGHERRALGVGREHGVEERGRADAGTSCATPPMRAREGSSMVPASSARSPRMRPNSVVLPVPLRPTTPTLWPVGTLAEAPSNRGRPATA